MADTTCVREPLPGGPPRAREDASTTRRRDETVPPAAERPAPIDELSWPDPIGDRRWVDESGVLRRLRGGGEDAALRRIDHLLRLPEVRVLHFSGTGSPADIEMPQRDAYWRRLRRLRPRLRDDGTTAESYRFAEFRDAARRSLVVVLESC